MPPLLTNVTKMSIIMTFPIKISRYILSINKVLTTMSGIVRLTVSKCDYRCFIIKKIKKREVFQTFSFIFCFRTRKLKNKQNDNFSTLFNANFKLLCCDPVKDGNLCNDRLNMTPEAYVQPPIAPELSMAIVIVISIGATCGILLFGTLFHR